MTAAIKFLSRSARSAPASPISVKTPVSMQSPVSMKSPVSMQSPVSIQTPSPPPVRRSPFPKKLYFYNPAQQKTREYSDTWGELNPAYEIQVFDVAQSEQFLFDEYGELYRDIFRFISDETIQSGFLGVCILHAYGGIYSDIGNEPLVPLDDLIESDVDFVTCNSYLYAINSSWNNMKFNFNPIFIASQKKNTILKTCIDWYIKRYEEKHPYDQWSWSIMNVFTETLHLENYSSSDGIYNANNMKIQIIKECVEQHNYTVYCKYGGKRVMNIST